MKSIKEIVLNSNYSFDFDNRNKAVKSINNVLNNSNIEIVLAKKGYSWKLTTGMSVNLIIKLNGKRIGFDCKDITPYRILTNLGFFLKKDWVKELIYSEVQTKHKCSKCNGTGYLPMFAHYANGVCFDCMGIGIRGKLSVNNIQDQKNLKGHPYLRSFYVSKEYSTYFPNDVKKLKPISYINHPTAETFLGENDTNYFIYQPVCQANSWYSIPKNDFDKFKTEWNKLKYDFI